MAPCVVQVKPNPRLLDANFEGYKLSLSPVPSVKCPTSVLHYSAPAHLYSLAHARLFSLHNHLSWEEWVDSGVYYINKSSQIVKACLQSDKFTFQESNIVYEMNPADCVDRYNPSLSFCSDNLALVSDGSGTLHLLSTGNRKRENSKWKQLFECRPAEAALPFVIADARINSNKIHCLLHRIAHINDGFQTVLEWITLSEKNGIWEYEGSKKMNGKGCLHYASFEPGCEAVYVASDNPLNFAISFQEICESQANKENNEHEVQKKLIYTWLQTGEDITLTLQLGVGFNRSKLNVESHRSRIFVQYDNNSLLEGELHNLIDEDLTTWNVTNQGRLDILLTKFASGQMWQSFLKDGDPEGEHVVDPTLIQEIHNRLAHLCSETEVQSEGPLTGFNNQQLEECDAVSEENSLLVRMDGNALKTTHVIPLSIHQVVLSVCLHPEKASAIGLRHDVDACIWLLEKVIGDIWPVKHEATLPAFGYVQSSKQNKKYNVCSPDFKYSVVCESTRHIFVYKRESEKSKGCQLRRRIGIGENEKVQVGEQLVLSVEKEGEVFGIVASNEILYVLTENSLIAYQMIETQ